MKKPVPLDELLAKDNRLLELSRSGPKNWFRDHVGRSIVCGCSLRDSDSDCDVGEALRRLRDTKRPDQS